MELTRDQALQKAVEAHKAGKIQEADRLYKSILKAQPKHPDANHNMGVLAVGVGKVEEALPFFKTALEANPNTAQFWLSYIDALIKLGQRTDAKAMFDQAKNNGAKGGGFDKLEQKLNVANTENTQDNATTETLETNQSSTLDAAVQLREAGKFNQAIDLLKDEIDRFPEDADMLALLSHCYLLADQVEEAKLYLDRAKKIAPDNASVGWNTARLTLKEKKPLEALNVARDTSQRFPDDVEGMGVLGACLRANGKADESLKVLNKAIELNPDYAEALINRGLIRLSQENKPEALADLELAYRLKPHIKQIWDLVVGLKVEAQEYSDAILFLNNMIEIDPEDEKRLATLALCYQHLKDFDAAIEAYNKALAIKPNYAEAYNNMGIALGGKGDLEAAIDSYQQALEIKPDYAEAYSNMGIALNDKGDSEAAIKSYKQALKIKPDYAEAHSNMGIALNDKGDPEAAIESFKKALKIKPDYAEAYNNMGIALQDKGDLEAALESYKQAIKIKPDYASAYNNMGNALKDKDDPEAAILNYKQAIKCKSDYPDPYYNMGTLFQENCQYQEAKECFDELSTNNIAVAKGLECTYHLEKYREFNEILKSIAKKNPANISVAAISAFASHQIKQKDDYPFCKNPIELVKISNINKHVPDTYQFINTILDEMNIKDVLWEPKNKTTIGGFRTSGNLFSKPSKAMQLLETIIQKELSLFNLEFKTHNEGLIRNWPKKNSLYGWYNRILQNGHHSKHIHPNGWVSGVFYLKTIEAPAQNEGAIEFGLHGYDYPVKDNDYPRRIYQPCDGDLVLFPSSLFHNTIPVIKDGERCVIAFDLVRQSPVML
mgnify:CR=1 FL=1